MSLSVLSRVCPSGAGQFDEGETYCRMAQHRAALSGRVALSDYLAPLQAAWRIHKAKAPEGGHLETDIPVRLIARPVAWRVEPRVFAILAFDGARPTPILAWRLQRLSGFAGLFVAAAHLLGFGQSRA